jgi:hypothetical protein
MDNNKLKDMALAVKAVLKDIQPEAKAALKDAILHFVSFVASSFFAHYAITLGEELNRRLEILLRAFLVQDGKILDRLFFGELGPLGSFHARIEMAAALGLISSDERHDLNLIRQIRNQIAHHHPLGTELPFDGAKIKIKCARLKTPLRFDNELFGQMFKESFQILDEPGYQFSKACIVLLVTLIGRTNKVVRRQAPGPLTETDIQTAFSEWASEEARLRGTADRSNLGKPQNN